MVSDERASACTASDGLEYRRFHFRVASFVEELAHRLDDRGTLEEDILHAGIDEEVNVALTVTKFRVVESVICHTVLFLHNGQGLQAL